MFRRLGQLVDAAAGLFEVRMRLALLDLERAGLAMVCYLVAAVMFLGSALAALAAIGLVTARQIGWPGALLLLAALGAAAGLLLVWIVRSSPTLGRRAANRARLEREIDRRSELLRASADNEEQTAPQAGASDNAISDLLGFVAARPQLVASAAFALLSVLGPFRVVRTVARAATAVGVAASIRKAVREVSDAAASRAAPLSTNHTNRNIPVNERG